MKADTTFVHRSDISIPLDRDLLKRLAAPAPLRLLGQVGFEWVCVLSFAAAAMHFSNFVFSLACILLIATRQHALLTLMHEFSHHQFSRTRNMLNDTLGDVLTALPFFITVHGFRRNHMEHHRHTATDRDPNWVSSLKRARYQFPKSRSQIWLEIAKHCVGFYTVAELKRYTVDARMAVALPRGVRIRRLVYWVVVLAIVTRFHLWPAVLLYWIVPMSTFLMAILYLRDIGEHFGMSTPGVLGSRTVLAGPAERFLIAQNAVNFHAEHHLFPSVPFFRLRELHEHLRQSEAYRARAVITRGYASGLIKEASALQRGLGAHAAGMLDRGSGAV